MLKVEFIPREKQKSEYDWVDLLDDDAPVGKVRCLIDHDTLTIFSINVYPEFKYRGFGKAFVEHCKKNYSVLIADRVRQKAINFWEKCGFKNNHDGNWIYCKNKNS